MNDTATRTTSRYAVRDGLVLRDGVAVASFSELKACKPDTTDTVEVWENRKRRQIALYLDR